jgi:hypothetical protein
VCLCGARAIEVVVSIAMMMKARVNMQSLTQDMWRGEGCARNLSAVLSVLLRADM